MSPKNDTQEPAKSTTATNKPSKGFTDQERAAMRERAKEVKKARGGKGDGETKHQAAANGVAHGLPRRRWTGQPTPTHGEPRAGRPQ